jgi:hypothetical protein
MSDIIAMLSIVFIEYTNFYLQSIKLKSPFAVEDAVAVIEENIVVDASAQAIAWGVYKGISSRLARQRCPGLIAHAYDPEAGKTLYHQLWKTFSGVTPQIEPVALNKAYLDLTGCVPRGKTLAGMMESLLWQVRFETGVLSRWGGGQDKWLARLSCGENKWIGPNEEANFLNHAPLSRLQLPEDILDKLFRYGLDTVGKLLTVPRSFFQTHLLWPDSERQKLLERVSDSVKFLYPPPEIKTEADLYWGSDEEIHEAVQKVADTAVQQLAELEQQATHLRIHLMSPENHSLFESTLSKPIFKAGNLSEIIHRFIQESAPQRLKRITLILGQLTARIQPQAELWQGRKQHIAERTEKLESIRQVLDRKFGTQTLLSGSQYSKIMPPRFAQMIYARRGQYIP